MNIDPDLINGLFEFAGGFLTWKNAFVLRQDKVLKGIYWPTSAFFTLWGLWNLLYYPALDQWVSFIGGVFLVSGNIAWVILAIFYNQRSVE